MIIWADTTTGVPTPTLTPDPDVDLNAPDLKRAVGCMPLMSVKKLPDSLYSFSSPPKKYPMKFLRK